MENKHLNPVTFENMPKAVAQVFQEVTTIKKELIELKSSFQPKEPTEYMTRKEVASMLKCDPSTVHNWTKKGKLIKYCIGDRTYYKRKEVEAALTSI